MLAVLLVTYVFNYLDRYLLTILVEPIKAELRVSDTVMGFLIGPAFALFYTLLGIPIARLADRRARRTIIATGFAFWSLLTAACGLTRTWIELAIARLGVGVGEAAGAAPSHSLISDYFPPQRRATALSIFQTGIYAGQILGLAVGGFLVGPLGWRMTFVVVGLPGIALALLVRWTVREPPRGALDPSPPARVAASLGAAFRHLWGLRTFRRIALGAGLASFAGTGFGYWVPTLFVRVHEMSYAQVGVSFGLINGVSAALGALAAGRLADRLGRRDARWYLGIPALSVALCLPFLCLVSLWPTPWVAIAFSVPAGIVGGGWAPPVYSVTQNLAPPHMRAVAASVLIFFITLLGMGAGPQAVGILSDWLAPTAGVDGLRYALVIVLATSLVGALLLALGCRSLRAELERPVQR